MAWGGHTRQWTAHQAVPLKGIDWHQEEVKMFVICGVWSGAWCFFWFGFFFSLLFLLLRICGRISLQHLCSCLTVQLPPMSPQGWVIIHSHGIKCPSLPSSTLLEECRKLEVFVPFLPNTVSVGAPGQSCREGKWHPGSWKPCSHGAATNRMQPGPLHHHHTAYWLGFEGAIGIGTQRDECTPLHLSDRIKSTAFKEFERDINISGRSKFKIFKCCFKRMLDHLIILILNRRITEVANDLYSPFTTGIRTKCHILGQCSMFASTRTDNLNVSYYSLSINFRN